MSKAETFNRIAQSDRHIPNMKTIEKYWNQYVQSCRMLSICVSPELRAKYSARLETSTLVLESMYRGLAHRGF